MMSSERIKKAVADAILKHSIDDTCDSIKVVDNVNHPSHYTSGDIECIDAIKEATKHLSGFEGFLTGNCIKYLWRWKHKNGLEDLKKTIWYSNKLIEEVGENDT